MTARRNHPGRVLVLINSLGPYGAENFVLNHVRHADRARFDVRVCQLGGDESLAPAMRAAGAEVINLHERHRFDPRALLALYKLLRRERIDVLQTHVAYAGVVGQLVGRAARVPVIVSTEQSTRGDRDYRPSLRRAMAVTFPLAHAHVYISDAVRRSFAAPAGAAIISNGIDGRALAATAPAARAAVRRELGIADDELAMVSVARLHPRKGQRLAIEALARLGAPRLSLWLIGAGPDEVELRARAAALGVADAVHLLGQRLDVPRLLGGFDLCLHPALAEGLGIAVIEAMAAGLPVVAAQVGGIPEYVRDADTGWLVPPGDLDALAARLAAVVADPAARRAAAARGQAHILAAHDIRASVSAYEALYTRLLRLPP